MNRRPLGDTGMWVPEIGFGAWQLGGDAWGRVDERDACLLVDLALDAGAGFFDTAPGYGAGRGEELLGRALRGQRDRAMLCTKTGGWEPAAGGPAALRASLEGSLRRLGTDRVEVLLLHNPPDEVLDQNHPLYAEMEKLKAEGKIRAYGASLDWSRPMRLALERTRGQVIEVLFNALHQEPALAFGQARERRVGLLAKVPLDSGWLGGAYTAASRFSGVRRRWSRADIRRRAALVGELGFMAPPGTEMSQAALQFVLAHPGVSCAIPGMRDLRQATSNLAAPGRSMPEETVRRVRELWEREVKDRPLPW